MADLHALTPCAGLLPQSVGAQTLEEVVPDHITSLAPWRGREAALSAALKSAHGMALPAPGRATGREGARCLWFGRGQILLLGPAPAQALAAEAALTDQSDAWAVLRLSGPGARDVLARLCPLDLRPGEFRRGHSARSLIGHINASITRTGEDSYLILAFRSMAASLVHELETAMKSLAARANG